MKNISYIIFGVIASLSILAPAAWAQEDEMQICASVVPCFKGQVRSEFVGSPSDACTQKYMLQCQSEYINELLQQTETLSKQIVQLKKTNKKKNRK